MIIDHGTDHVGLLNSQKKKKKPLYIWTELGDNSCLRIKFKSCRGMILRLYRPTITSKPNPVNFISGSRVVSKLPTLNVVCRIQIMSRHEYNTI